MRIHRSPVDSPTKAGQWRGALMFSLMCAWTNRWAQNRDAGDLRRHGTHCDVIVMIRNVHMVRPWCVLSWFDTHHVLYSVIFILSCSLSNHLDTQCQCCKHEECMCIGRMDSIRNYWIITIEQNITWAFEKMECCRFVHNAQKQFIALIK